MAFHSFPSTFCRSFIVLETFGPGKNDGYPVSLSMKPLLLKAREMGEAFFAPNFDAVRCLCMTLHLSLNGTKHLFA